MNNIYFIGQISLGIYVALEIVFVALILRDRSILDRMTKKNYSGGFHGGTYFMQPLLPIDKCNDEEINYVIKKHNYKIGLFYGAFLFLVLGIVLLNLGD